MRHDLGGYDLSVITEAFQRWRRGNKKIPTCNCIIDLCETIVIENHRAAQPYIPAKPVERPFKPNFYEGKFWAQFEDYERQQFIQDLTESMPALRRLLCIAYYAPEILAENQNEC